MRRETTQFNGKVYYRYPEAKRLSDRRYFRYGGRYLHRDVWEIHYGTIPDGYEIHHKDKDAANNAIENLEIVTRKQHIQSYHRGPTTAKTAHLDRVRPLTKKWHKSKQGRAWHSTHAKAQYDAREPRERVCEHCGAVYTVKWERSFDRFCSNRCKTAARYASGVDNEVRSCAHCGEMFTINKYTKTKTCSRSCANRWQTHEK